MYAITAGYKTAIQGGGYTIDAAIQIWSGTTQTGEVTAENGTFTVDRASAQRRRCNLTIAPAPGVFPTSPQAPLAPFGNEIRPYFGVRYPDGTSELVPMGVYVLTTVEGAATSADFQITVSGYDRSWSVAQRKFRDPYTVTSADPAAAIQAILDAQFPGLPALNMIPTGFALPDPLPSFREGDDPWAACLTIADAAGCELFFDLAGIPTGRPIPDPATTAASWAFADGPAGPTSVKRIWTREGVSNDFIVSGSGSNVQPPVRAEQSDTNPTSPTYTAGSFGDIPTFINSTLVTDTAAAQAAAANALTAALGLIETVDVGSVPNPAWDIDDVFSLTNTATGCDGLYVVDSITHVFHAAAETTLTARKITR